MKNAPGFNQDQELMSFFQYFYQTEVLGYYFPRQVLSQLQLEVELLPILLADVVPAATATTFHVEVCYSVKAF